MRRAFALVGIGALLTACGGTHADPSRSAVKAYIQHLNAIERRAAVQASVLAQQSRDASSAGARRRIYVRTETALTKLKTRVAAAPAPAQARRLRERLLALIDREILLAHESAQLAAFDPAFTKALAPLAAANRTAQSQLKATHRAAAVEAAVGRYRTAVRAALAGLRTLSPPPIEQSLYSAQVARLTALDAALGRLQSAIAAHDAADVARAEHAVSVASVSSDSLAVQRATRAEVRQYDALVRGVAQLAARVAQERNRLQTTLP